MMEKKFALVIGVEKSIPWQILMNMTRLHLCRKYGYSLNTFLKYVRIGQF